MSLPTPSLPVSPQALEWDQDGDYGTLKPFQRTKRDPEPRSRKVPEDRTEWRPHNTPKALYYVDVYDVQLGFFLPTGSSSSV